jgi:hypothetical protein
MEDTTTLLKLDFMYKHITDPHKLKYYSRNYFYSSLAAGFPLLVP